MKSKNQVKPAGKVAWKLLSSGMIWKPTKPGETLEGIISSRKTGYDAKRGQEYPIVNVTASAGVYALRTDKAMLQTLNVLPLTTPVRLVFRGKKKVNNLNPMHVIDVFTPERTTFEDDWTGGKFIRKSRKTNSRKK